ncbi:hypothetical protein ADIMK_2647 [Marinobacterium lacunae]|uniref:Uncharacterized protein n=1 Tax=Marinobacterium lacunae TaxID=1232683 RepID=A0A081FX68_9GAMM|nr:hypothetical protein [Marinobacterium lacunae]KEA63123.1 hypothetical protein ADIMK_2647 [Marinobacterium lacunae]
MQKLVAAPAATNLQSTNTIKPARKIERVLIYVLNHGSINRREAEKDPVFDHCLPSTISEFKSRNGIEFIGAPEKLTGYEGHTAMMSRYRLTAPGVKQARKLVNELRRKRGLPPIAWGE